MEVVTDTDRCPSPPEGTAVTIGAYDGVHRGHQAVIATVRRLAAERGLETAVVTFDRHPASVVRPASAPHLLTDLDQKLELLAATGLDHAVVLHFDEARSKESAEDFVQEVLVGCLNTKLVVVGEDFHFGHQRRGNVELLRAVGAEQGFEVLPLGLVGVDGEPTSDEGDRVSSTAIRQALGDGDLERANRLLGRPYEVRGIVEHGDERARTWGVPTANVAVPEETMLPADGIYACWYERPSGEVLPSAVSLGRRPTFYENQPYRLLEAHLLDFDGDLYGERAEVRFVTRLRAEERYDSVDELVAQIHQDVADARAALSQDAL